ncbi:unnamed protein product [Rodentolepis nana]|uniref:Separase n=1 Tax=Rodentolepis nana TaxID=102285 RepID=A0A0R3TRJ7_RODNA|nr:unnamed protein product [Rodentolepis nana]
MNRKILIQHLLESDDMLSISAPLPPMVEGQPAPPEPTEPVELQHKRGFILLENLCRIMVLNVEYFCTSTKVIPVNENNSVLVVWSQSNQLPMDLEVIESNLLFLSRIPQRFIASDTVGSSWWGHLLNIWISDDGSGAHNLPKIQHITHSSETMRTKLGLISLSTSNEFTISPKLRAAFLASGLSQLRAIALAGITGEDFLQMLVDIPTPLLDSNTATRLVECAGRLNITPLTAKQKLILQSLQMKANLEATSSAADSHTNSLLTTSRVFVRQNLTTPPPLLSPKKSFTSPRILVSPNPLARPPVSPESPTASKNLWRDFFNKLAGSQADFHTQSEAFCSALIKINSSAVVRNRWMQDLVNVLQTVQTPTKRGRGTSSSASSKSPPMGDMLKVLPNLTAVTFAYSLIRSCLLLGLTMSDNKTVNRYQKAIELSISEFPKIAFHTSLMERLLLNPLRSALDKKDGSQVDVLLDEPKSSPLGLPLNPERLESLTLAQQMQVLTIYGISSIEIESEDGAWSLIQKLVLHNKGDANEDKRRSRYFLAEEIVHNTSPTILRECLRRILQEDVITLDSELVLDTILGIINLPALRFAVPLEEYHSKPDAGNIYSLVHRLTNPHEGMRLITHICLEASKSPELIRDKLISIRAPIIDLALQSYPSPLPFMEYLANFRELPPSHLPSDLTKCHLPIDLSDSAKSLLLCTYFRRPGIIYALSRTETQAFLRNPGTSPKCFESREVNRIGGNILTSLSSKFDAVRVFAGPQIIAMASQHPLLALRLVPLIAGLAQGRFDVSLTSSNNEAGRGGGGGGDVDDIFFNPSAVAGTISWKAFESSKQDNFYFSVLRFMEVLAFSTDSKHDGVLFSPEAECFREHIHSIFASMIHVMASYYRQLRYSEQFEHRLSALLRAYRRGIGKDSQWSAVSVEELNWLSARSSLFTGFTSDSPSASSIILPPPSIKNLPHLQSSIQKIRNPTSLEAIEHTLLDLEKMTERKPLFLEPFVADLEHHLLKSVHSSFDGCSPEDAKLQPLLYKLFFRYYRSVPHQAPEVLERVFLPCLRGSLNVGTAIDYLPEAAVLAPHLIPRLLHAAASRLVVRSGSAAGCDSIVNVIKGIVFRLPLEGFYQASIDYATGGIQSAISGSKFQKRGLNKN